MLWRMRQLYRVMNINLLYMVLSNHQQLSRPGFAVFSEAYTLGDGTTPLRLMYKSAAKAIA